ncbi:hypothetical protein [Thermoplasma acidophilum]|uniref:Uncharacterized protein n=1 Tax=Thermoplasma acidophilum (strain ATCC 25905 / DSM 1728 / JCM 9062 / NBRC 15155 / AMRC-C165) TaxID=273075 RepID=Q9HKD8_THEAC|nr:hypothetical protein [Thermoplasma acidophilum]CAC11801.1 hypothetical protein [Thermoplasma acidophilum]
MKFEYEYMETPEDLLMSLSAGFAMAMRNIATVYSYKGYLSYYTPAMSDGEELTMFVTLTKGELAPGLIDFDSENKRIEHVKKATNPEAYHFLVIRPQISTVLDKAIYDFEKSRNQP